MLKSDEMRLSLRVASIPAFAFLAACGSADGFAPEPSGGSPPAPTRPGASPAGLDAEAPPPDASAVTSDAGSAVTACASDDDCRGGDAGTRVCATSGDERGQCITACHSDADCSPAERCDTSSTPHWTCIAADAGAHDAGAPGCPVLAYPSGVRLQTYPDPATTASYANHLAAGQSAPQCFVDTDRLVDPTSGQSHDLSIKVSTHFALSELVGTEVSQYGHFVLMEPSAVLALEGFAQRVGVSVSINSGFRSPRHQEDTCASLCGNKLGCPGTCANSSRHMWGDAFDLPLDFYTKTDEDRACAAGFKFAYLESGTHLHIDQNPAYATCVEQ